MDIAALGGAAAAGAAMGHLAAQTIGAATAPLKMYRAAHLLRR